MARASTLWRSFVLAIGGVGLGALPNVVFVGSVERIPVFAFVGLKAIWAGVLAAAISPVVAWWALLSSSAEGEGGSNASRRG